MLWQNNWKNKNSIAKPSTKTRVGTTLEAYGKEGIGVHNS
jgi:hypothetical protein